MRILHTSDWHLGQTLHGVSRKYEHACFLNWLLDAIEQHKADALLVAGDVFDVASPGAEAQAEYFRFLANARYRFPKLNIVITGGNHDSPARLDAAQTILRALDVRVVGGLPKTSDNTALNLDKILIPLTGPTEELEACLIAIPFLRPRDLPRSIEEAYHWTQLSPELIEEQKTQDAYEIRQHRALITALVGAATKKFGHHIALIATAHAYVAGGQLSELSERKIQQGYQNALPASIFPDSLCYVGLGHLHLAQQINEVPHIRYSGSPIPLSMAEHSYPHQIVLIDTNGSDLKSVIAAHIPRFIDMLRIPEEHAPLQEVLELLRQLPDITPSSSTKPPFVEVRILLQEANPRLRQHIEAALENKHAHLLKIDVKRPKIEADINLSNDLDDLSPDDVFQSICLRSRGYTPPTELYKAFTELLEQVYRGEKP